MRLWVLLAPALVVGGLGIAGVVDATAARADCVSSGGTTICSQGDVRGADTGQGPGSTGGSAQSTDSFASRTASQVVAR